MTAARDVIAKCWDDKGALGEQNADVILRALLSAPDSVRLELAAKLNPWRLPTEAPKQDQWCICLLPPAYRQNGPMRVAQYNLDNWLSLGCEPLAWLPAPSEETEEE